jgi:hypothetical protein
MNSFKLWCRPEGPEGSEPLKKPVASWGDVRSAFQGGPSSDLTPWKAGYGSLSDNEGGVDLSNLCRIYFHAERDPSELLYAARELDQREAWVSQGEDLQEYGPHHHPCFTGSNSPHTAENSTYSRIHVSLYHHGLMGWSHDGSAVVIRVVPWPGCPFGFTTFPQVLDLAEVYGFLKWFAQDIYSDDWRAPSGLADQVHDFALHAAKCVDMLDMSADLTYVVLRILGSFLKDVSMLKVWRLQDQHKWDQSIMRVLKVWRNKDTPHTHSREQLQEVIKAFCQRVPIGNRRFPSPSANCDDNIREFMRHRTVLLTRRRLQEGHTWEGAALLYLQTRGMI